MDQDSFRQLLQVPHTASSLNGRSQVQSREPSSSKAKSSGPAQPSFKPRKIKKTEARYRDRAAERRVGGGNDYAQVEAVLEEFERRTANEEKSRVEEQRRYLGGDSDHSILVKGLDMALLEQNKARTITSTEDDEFLEQAFVEASAESTVPKKRTREDLIQELKKRKLDGTDKPVVDKAIKSAEEEARLLEEAKKAGKFKPIGFKPIGTQEGKPKKRKAGEKEKKGQKQTKKPKRADAKESETTLEPKGEVKDESQPIVSTSKSNVVLNSAVNRPLTPPPDEDFDIFAGAGEYEGFGDEDDEESDHEKVEAQKPDTEHNDHDRSTSQGDQPTRGKWFVTDDPEPNPPPVQTTHPEPDASKPPQRESSPHDEEVQPEQPMRLRPLESSALPSIRDFLAMDEAAEKQEKRKQRKEKRKSKKKSGDDDDD